MSPLKQRAHALLDDVRAGLYHPLSAVNWALRMLGEPVHELRGIETQDGGALRMGGFDGQSIRMVGGQRLGSQVPVVVRRSSGAVDNGNGVQA